mmetsp:Transcript_6971/g.11229  ORF Transcript_6971/g.11229 Transcript_6971/m.11229 type:complete len:262 (+) Transcript_6971:94-879(+)
MARYNSGRDNPKNASQGVLPRQTAVGSRSSHELQRLFFQTSSSDRNDMREAVQLSSPDRSESLGQIHYIGKKSTKYMPYRYSQAPLHNKTDCWYANDFCEKKSDWAQNKEIVAWIRGPRPEYKAPLIATTSRHRQDFQKPSKDEHNRANQPNKSPEWVRTKTVGCGDFTAESLSSSHRMHMAPHRIASQDFPHKDNLYISGLDSGDCYRTTYRNEFVKKQRPVRCSTAPCLHQDETLLLDTTRRDPEIAQTTRNAFSKPGR